MAGKWKPIWTISAVTTLAVLLVTIVGSAVTFANGVSADRKASVKTDAAFSKSIDDFSGTVETLTASVDALTLKITALPYLRSDVEELKLDYDALEERVRTLERQR